MKKIQKSYKIAFNSFDGVSPQRDAVYSSKKKAQDICDKLNEGKDTTYGEFIVIVNDFFA